MTKLFTCRRTFVALVGMLFMLILGLVNKTDVSMTLATVVIAIAGANAAQGTMETQAKASTSASAQTLAPKAP